MRKIAAIVSGVALIAMVAGYKYARAWWHPAYISVMGQRTVSDVIGQVGAQAESRLRPRFDRAGVAYPPPRITLIGLKDEKQLELWAESGGKWAHVHTYAVEAASGTAGPKLKQGDRQVPEGLYRISFLNPNSSYHLSMKLDYPNQFDLAKAREDRRTDLGGDIFIHGKDVSIGCLAMGDEAIEELFTLVARIGPANARAVIAPNDLRTKEPAINSANRPAWIGELYSSIKQELDRFKKQ